MQQIKRTKVHYSTQNSTDELLGMVEVTCEGVEGAARPNIRFALSSIYVRMRGAQYTLYSAER